MLFHREVWQEEQNKSKENSFTQQRIELFAKYSVWNYLGFLYCLGKPDMMILVLPIITYTEITYTETYILEPLKW